MNAQIENSSSLVHHWRQALRVCAQLIVGRGTPESVPYSTRLFQTTLVVALLAALTARLVPLSSVSALHVVVNAVGEIGVLCAFFWVLFGLKKRRERFIKFATCVLIISACGDTCLMVARSIFDAAWASRLTILIMLLQVSGVVTAVRRTLETEWLPAIGVTFAYIISVSVYFAYARVLLTTS